MHTYNALENMYHGDHNIGHNDEVKKIDSSSSGMGINTEQAELMKSAIELNELTAINIMIPIKNIFMISQDEVLDKFKLQQILEKGYSRIPIFNKKDKNDIVGKT